MIHLIKSNRMETLMQGLLQILGQGPADPVTEEWIGIQSKGMKQWITASMASAFGVCANLRFLFPREILASVLQTDQPLLDEETLVWAVIKELNEAPDSSPLSDLRPYYASDDSGRKQVQLAMEIARVLDDYQVYRPDLLLAWEQKDTPRFPGERIEAWQAVLWQQIAPGSHHLATRMDEFLKAAARGSFPDMPSRICLFGISALPPSFLNLFASMASVIDIYLFLLTPSNQFFFDIASPRLMDRLALETMDNTDIPDSQGGHFEVTNPLLGSMGRSGRDFHGSLESLDYLEPFGDLFQDPFDIPSDPVMLSVLQSDILNLVHRKAGAEASPVPVAGSDRSVTFHACHSPMREAQVLKDILLDEMERNPGLLPHDIIVMMPDIEAYAPYIESVFSGGNPLPFSISDRRHKTESQILDAFLKILDLKGSRLEQSRVLDLLFCPVVADNFGISQSRMDAVRALVEQAGILWGRDPEHRRAVSGKGFAENTWSFGFRRLFAGYALPGGRDELMENVLPSPCFEGPDADILGRFAHFCDTLFSGLDRLNGKKPLQEWETAFKRIILSMMARTEAREADTGFLIQTLEAVTRGAETAGFSGRLSFEAARSHIEKRLDTPVSQGRFMAGGITFCNLMPMRSIPFKIVALMGMDESAFPRKTVEPGFDLVARYPRQGDKKRRDQDRYLFLESLLSARERFVVTYTGFSIRDNSPIPPSGVISELADAITQGFEFPDKFQWRFDHPLHPFSRTYFDGTPGYFSFSRRFCRLAESQADRAAGSTGPQPDLQGVTALQNGTGLRSETVPVSEPDPDGTPETVDLETFNRFFRNPAADFVRSRIGLTFPETGEPAPDREAFRLRGLPRYHLGARLLDQHEMAENAYDLARAGGTLPLGRQGRLEWEAIRNGVAPIRDLAREQKPDTDPASVTVNLDIGGLRLSGTVSGVHEDSGRFVMFEQGFGRLTPRRLLSGWIRHLALTLSCPDRAVETRMIGQDPKGRKPAVAYRFDPVSGGAEAFLSGLASLYLAGREQPLLFFPDTCFALADALSTKGFDLSEPHVSAALQKAGSAWCHPFTGTGDGNDRYIAACFGDVPDQPDQASRLITNSLAVFRPLLENLIR